MSNATQIYKQLSSGGSVEVELLFPVVTYNSAKVIHKLSCEIDKDFWDAMQALQHKGLRLKAVLSILPDDEGASEQGQGIEPETEPAPSQATPDANGSTSTKRKPKKERPPKGMYGPFWKEICKLNFFSNLILQEWLEDCGPWTPEIAANQDEQIRQLFGVTSRTFISPDELLRQLQRDLPQEAVDGLEITISRAAERAGQPVQTERAAQ